MQCVFRVPASRIKAILSVLVKQCGVPRVCLALPGEGCNCSRSQGTLFGGIYNLVGMTTATFIIQIQSRVNGSGTKEFVGLILSKGVTRWWCYWRMFGKGKIRKGTGIHLGVHSLWLQFTLPATPASLSLSSKLPPQSSGPPSVVSAGSHTQWLQLGASSVFSFCSVFYLFSRNRREQELRGTYLSSALPSNISQGLGIQWIILVQGMHTSTRNWSGRLVHICCSKCG